ncbi:hypothetical protein ACIOWG_00205 [Streptomyces sp. NPDC087658]|uniref:hypothetical protein n=1 Tax=Streptomyces sp. NPDC087658 TaxID=3365800 RepID=UPI00380B0ACD
MSRRLFASALVAGVTFACLATAPAAVAAPPALSCTTSVGSTGGWAECTGSGTWRVKSVCSALEGDKYTQWVTTSKKTRVYATDCTFSISDVIVQTR